MCSVADDTLQVKEKSHYSPGTHSDFSSPSNMGQRESKEAQASKQTTKTNKQVSK